MALHVVHIGAEYQEVQEVSEVADNQEAFIYLTSRLASWKFHDPIKICRYYV